MTGSVKSILVADDEQGIRDLLRFTLEPMGFEVMTVCDGMGALQAVRDRAFDLIILDVHMPRMGGPEALAKIRVIRPTQRVMIVSSSSDASHAFEKRAVEKGASVCLFKPIELDELIASIDRAIREPPSPASEGGEVSADGDYGNSSQRENTTNRTDNTASAPAPAIGHASSTSTRAAVLVIDDEPGIRDMLSYELSQEGFDVETAENGFAAVAALKRRKFDLAVTDLKMPDMDGVATVEALRALDPDIEVIVATGYASVETAVACMKRGAYDYIQKPYELTELKLLLVRAMQKSHLQGVVALYEASRALLATVRQSELVRLVLGIAQRVLRADGTALLLWREGVDRFEVHRLENQAQPSDATILELARHATTSGRALCLPSAAAPGPSLSSDDSGYSSALIYPLSGKNRPLGLLALFRRQGSPAFVQSELQKGNVFANQLALSLDNARLYEELEAKVAELIATRDQLVQAEKLAIAAHLAGAVAHEINNPLAFVRTNLDALRDYLSNVGALWLAAKAAALYLRDFAEPDAKDHSRRLYAVAGVEGRTESLVQEIAEVIDETLEGVRRIADLVAGFTRLAEPAEAAPPERVDADALLRECLELLPHCAERRARILGHQASEACETIACREDLRTALLNLLTYLCSSAREDRSESAVTLSVRMEGARPVVRMSDSALRLSANERAHLFDPRVEVDTRRGRTMRLNIGLPVAHHLLTRNGAQVAVHADGEGVQFHITLAAVGR